MSKILKYDQQNVRRYHSFLLLNLIQKHKSASRTQLAGLTQMSNTTVGKIIRDLIDEGLVIEVGQDSGDLGRRATLLELNPEGAYTIGVEIEQGQAQLACVSLTGSIIAKDSFTFDKVESPGGVLDTVAEAISAMVARFDDEQVKKILAVGMSLPGLVTWPDGKVISVPQLKWSDVEVKAHLEAKLPFSVYVDNHVRSILLAETLFGNLTHVHDAACIYIGSGVGAAVMLGGEIARGAGNTLGEIGHMTIDGLGSMCDCGRLGCAQTFLSTAELEKQAQIGISEIFAQYRRGESPGKVIIERAREQLGILIANTVCIYNPEVIVLDGPMFRDFPEFITGIEELIDQAVWSALQGSFRVVGSSKGVEGGLIGASALVLNEYLRRSLQA